MAAPFELKRLAVSGTAIPVSMTTKKERLARPPSISARLFLTPPTAGGFKFDGGVSLLSVGTFRSSLDFQFEM